MVYEIILIKIFLNPCFPYSKLWMDSILLIHFCISFRLTILFLWKMKMKTIFIPQKAVHFHLKKARLYSFKHLKTSSRWWGHVASTQGPRRDGTQAFLSCGHSIHPLWQVEQRHQWVTHLRVSQPLSLFHPLPWFNIPSSHYGSAQVKMSSLRVDCLKNLILSHRPPCWPYKHCNQE